MATSATSYFATEPLAGCDFTKIRSSAQGPEFPIKMRVSLARGKVAMYVIAGAAIGPYPLSGSAGTADVSGTVSISATPWMSMAQVTTTIGDYFWVRSSADVVVP